MSKVWFITGSSRGFGREFALAALERGDQVAATARNPETLNDLVERFESGTLEPEDFVRELSKTLELRVDYNQFCEIWNSVFLPQTLIPESMLKGIKERYRLILLSNTNAIHFKMLEQSYPCLRHFDDMVLSYRVGALKPAPAIYREAIARAECRPEECFFTDDIPEYVAGARAAGIDAVQFQSATQLESALKERGIKW